MYSKIEMRCKVTKVTHPDKMTLLLFQVASIPIIEVKMKA
jgi:hypothetical protein